MDRILEKMTAGNYWLTKSMEFNKIKSSGTLWYLKKWIVYYYYIFMRNRNLYPQDYSEIIEIFDNYIDSLPKKLKQSAKNFFYKINIKNINQFNSFQNFISKKPLFSDTAEERDFMLKAKKFYFLYIMNIGGQSGYKKLTKELIDRGTSFYDTLKTVKEKMINEGHTEEKFKRDIEGDYPAAIRNERQIYFYYGLFHGRDEKNLQGFYNLTNVGKSILKSNFHETIVLWEHQKIKMVSQSPVSDIQNLNDNCSSESFSVNDHPYFSLLYSIQKLQGLRFDDYMYGISRSNNFFKIKDVTDAIKFDREVFLNESKKRINKFNRRGDSDNTDFKKELKKYLLGIYEIPLDQGLNPYSFLKTDRSLNINIDNKTKLKFTLSTFRKIIKNLDNLYETKYLEFEEATKRNYIAGIKEENFVLSNSLKYDWSKYCINLEKGTILFLIYWGISCIQDKFDFDLSKQNIGFHFKTYKYLIDKLGLNKTEYIEKLIEIQNHVKSNADIEFNSVDEGLYLIDDPREINADVSIQNLKELSYRAFIENSYDKINRKRSNSLVKSLRVYYLNNFRKESKLIPCECCSKTTFINTNNLPFLEFHHLIPFSTDNGPDHYLNLFGLCSNCHSKMHHLHHSLKSDIYQKLEQNNHFKINYFKRLETLYLEGLLEAIHLDYLLKENIISNDDYEVFMSKNSRAA
tara:strand:- start:2384 stop:4444 length:2061 start_codon:yes stop_codon:yes gene_type:complete